VRQNLTQFLLPFPYGSLPAVPLAGHANPAHRPRHAGRRRPRHRPGPASRVLAAWRKLCRRRLGGL